MVSFIVGLIIGAFVGWNVPQPAWAQRWWQKLKDIVKKNIETK